MLSLIYNFLQSLQICFTRKISFKKFVIIIIGLMLVSDQYGVSSIIRSLGLSPLYYEGLIQFFSSTAFSLSELVATWTATVAARAPIYRVGDRAVLIGDHKKLPKEARKMPGVKRHNQESENAGKPRSIFGHCFGCIGVVVGDAYRYMCLPLVMRLHDGLNFIDRWRGKESKTMIRRIIDDACRTALRLGTDSYLVLDGYFLSEKLLRPQERFNETENIRLDVITRAKSNCVAYYPLTEEEKLAQKGKVGAPRKKGASVKVGNLFDEKKDAFKKATVMMYGKKKTVRYYSIKLVWRQGYYRPLLFVLVKVDGRRLVLVSTDLDQDPKEVIHLYSLRFSVEESFKDMRLEAGTFNYRFWSKFMRKLNYFAHSGDKDPLEEITDKKVQARIIKAVERVHRYVNFSCMALGLFQILCFEFGSTIDPKEICYMRTYRGGDTLTVGLMKRYFSQNFFGLLYNEPVCELRQIITQHQSGLFGMFSSQNAA